MTDSIVSKIRAILNRAEEGRGATEEERDTAMKMAEKLLFKHTSTRQHDYSGANAGSDAGGRVDVTLGNKMGRGGTRLLGS